MSDERGTRIPVHRSSFRRGSRMPVEFIGMIGTRPASEIDGAAVSIIGGHVDPDYVREFARAHEDGGFDRVLIGYGSTGPDGFSVAAYAASVTDRLSFLIAHRP